MGAEPGKRRPRIVPATGDLIAIVLIAVMAAVLAERFELFEAFDRWVKRHPRSPLEDLVVVGVVLSVLLGLFSWRRWRELSRDMAAREKAEEQLRQAEARFRTLVEQIPAVTHISGLDETSSTIYIGPQVEGLLGYAREDWLADPKLWVKVLHPDHLDRLLKLNDDHIHRGVPIATEYPMIARDGRTVWIQEEAVVIRDQSGRPRFSQGVWIDITARKQAEEALRETEARYRALIEQIPAVTYISRNDRGFPLVYISPQVESMLGFSPASLYEDSLLWERHMHPKDIDRARLEFEAGLASGRRFSTEYRIVTPDGRELWVRDESVPLPDEAGRTAEIQGVIFDITERKRAEEAIRESEDRYRSLVEASPDAILVHSDGRLVFANQAAASLLGAEMAEELIGRPVFDIVHPDHREIVEQRLLAQAHGERAPLIEERFVRLDGSIIDVEVAGIPVTYRGNPAGQIVVRDVTRRKEAERQLREAEDRYRTLVEHIPAVTYIWDSTREGAAPPYISPQLEPLLGFTPEEFTTERGPWSTRMHPEDRERVLAETARTDETGEPFACEYRMLARDGREVWVRDEAEVVSRDEQGRPQFWQGMMFDITERKRAEEERAVLLSRLVAAQEDERRRIAEDIHDDSVQKMTAVGLRLEALRRRATDPEQLSMIDRLEESVGLAIGRLRHLLFELRPPAIDREGLAAALRQYLKDVRAESGIQTHLDDRLVSEPPSDTRMLAYRIAQEALTNVRKHAQASRVDVLLQPQDGGLLVRITDDGVGFEDSEGSDAVPGHLGLSAMRERAQFAGGRLRVLAAPGSGTTVEFWLPVASPRARGSAA